MLRHNIFSKKRSKELPSGQATVEVVAGLSLIIVIVIFLLDICVLVLAGGSNGDLAARAARAAASQADSNSAAAAVTQIQNQFVPSPIVPSIQSLTLAWNSPSSGLLTVTSVINVKLPVPIPFQANSTIGLTTQQIDPIVGLSPPLTGGT